MCAPVAPVAVLDTNVVLDWLVFDNPDCAPLARAILERRVRWVATPAMRAELAHVLGRGHLDRWQPDLAAVWNAWDQHCENQDEFPRVRALQGLRCSDPDDQKFIDLAVAMRAGWLLTRDRAVLRLARRLATHGVAAMPPGRWSGHAEPDGGPTLAPSDSLGSPGRQGRPGQP